MKVTFIGTSGALCAAALAAALSGCGGQPGTEKTLALPARETFDDVGRMLQGQCGSLDCHGHIARNFRIYGADGLRLTDVTAGPNPTTVAEFDATYYSLVALEPEELDLIVTSGGTGADTLLLVRKGRGTVHHKGGAILTQGGAADLCLMSWFSPAVDVESCIASWFPEPPDWP